jgi:hypothetical protein
MLMYHSNGVLVIGLTSRSFEATLPCLAVCVQRCTVRSAACTSPGGLVCEVQGLKGLRQKPKKKNLGNLQLITRAGLGASG